MKLSHFINLKLILIYLLPIWQVISPQISVALSVNGKGLEGMRIISKERIQQGKSKILRCTQ